MLRFSLRLSLAFLFIAHIYWKFAIKGFAAWWSGMTEAGYPHWTVYYTLFVEFTGATFLLLGVYTRYVCIIAMPVMVAVINHWATRKGFWFTIAGAELPLAWLIMLVTRLCWVTGLMLCQYPACRGTVTLLVQRLRKQIDASNCAHMLLQMRIAMSRRNMTAARITVCRRKGDLDFQPA
jgi:putative oxidoreductase